MDGGFLELDVYWLSAAADWPAALAVRSSATVHVKDGGRCHRRLAGAAVTPAGTGRSIWYAGGFAPCQWHVVEFDECAGDVFEAIAAADGSSLGLVNRLMHKWRDRTAVDSSPVNVYVDDTQRSTPTKGSPRWSSSSTAPT
jgi:hypothetical protein